MYAPVIDDDSRRPSFYLMENDDKIKMQYSFFLDNISRIMNNYSFKFNMHPDISWLKNKPIIHRGVLKKDIVAHTKHAFEECIVAQYPIQVDLLCLRDGNIVVGRDDHNIGNFDGKEKLSDFTIMDVRRYNRYVGDANSILKLDEFLSLISGRIPILLEIKVNSKNCIDDIKTYINTIIITLRKYSMENAAVFHDKYKAYGFCAAVHSSNPYVLEYIKKTDPTIPCGIISGELENVEDEEFRELHIQGKYMDIFTPDFICYDVRSINNGIGQEISKKFDIPLIAWTIKNAEQQYLTKEYSCDNFIIEGSKDYE